MSARFRREDVSSVPGGWKVRTVKAGTHRVRVAFPPGRKQKGSGRLVSVLHPVSGSNPCANPCTMRSSNPAELMVMSANHPPRTKLARQKDARARAAAIRAAAGRNPANMAPDKPYRIVWDGTEVNAAKTQAEAEHMLAKMKKKYKKTLRDSDSTLKIEYRRQNPAELLVMGANPNPRVEVVAAPNPPTEEIVEAFTGREVEFMDVYNEPHMPRGRYAKLGPLVALYIKPAKGGQVQRIGASEAVGHDFPSAWGGRPPLVVCDSTARQIYFVDGHQDISSALAAFGAIDRGNGIVELGKGRRIDYQCRKEHVASPDEDLWKHEHGEEGGSLPTVLFDTRTKRILYEGGDYRIEGPWIRD